MFLFMNSAAGYLLAHRILAEHAEEFAFTPRVFTVLGTFCMIFFLAIFILCRSPLMLWLFIGILLITLKLFPLVFRIFLLRRLEGDLLPLFDHVILALQTGKSFRQGMLSAIECRQGWIRNQLRDLFNSVIYGDDAIVMKSALLKDLQMELLEIDRSNNRVVEQVRSLRRQLKMREDFRRRSGQVTQQIKMQAIIVTVLYLGLLAFVIAQFGGREHANLLLFSNGIFFCGLITVFQIGRRMKWKV